MKFEQKKKENLTVYETWNRSFKCSFSSILQFFFRVSKFIEITIQYLVSSACFFLSQKIIIWLFDFFYEKHILNVTQTQLINWNNISHKIDYNSLFVWRWNSFGLIDTLRKWNALIATKANIVYRMRFNGIASSWK